MKRGRVCLGTLWNPFVQDEDEGQSHRKRKTRGNASPKKAKKRAISSKDTPASGGLSHSLCSVLFPSCVVMPP